MAHLPSLYHLYQRGRYSGEADLESESGRKRSEEFAVAALGFVLHHNREFKRRFIKFACEQDVIGDEIDQYEVNCQDGNCADLSIVRKDQQAIIVEAKIGSTTQAHQRPWEKTFWEKRAGLVAEMDGYGFQIYEHQRFKACPDKFYVLLQNDVESKLLPLSEDPKNGGRKVRCFSKKWGDLGHRTDYKASVLVEDLLDSLAELNIPELKLRKCKGMKPTDSQIESAATMLTVLKTVAENLKILGTAGRIAWAVGDERDDAYFGIWVPRRPYEVSEWATLSPDKNEMIGWFGYEGKRNGRVEALTISFGRGGDSAELKKFLEKKLQRTVEAKSDYFFVQKPPNEKQGDADWLVQILKSLREAKTKRKQT